MEYGMTSGISTEMKMKLEAGGKRKEEGTSYFSSSLIGVWNKYFR